jgi:ubiquinone biosynthesis protein UbiJ
MVGTLRYAVEGGDVRLAEETVSDMQRVARHLTDKYRPAELIAAARSADPRSAQLAELYLERCYKLVDEDYAALADLDTRIDELKS